MNESKKTKTGTGPRETQSRGWMLTIPEQPTRPDPKDPQGPRLPDGDPRTEQDLVEAFGDWPWCGQLEEGQGETHYRHYQLWMETPAPKRFRTVKNRLSQAGMADAHIEPRKGTKAQAFDYVTKADTRLEGPFFHGLTAADAKKEQGRRNDLEALREAVMAGMGLDDILMDPELSLLAPRYLQWLRTLIDARLKSQVGLEDRDVHVHYLYGASGIGKTRSVMDLYPREDIFRVSDYERSPFDGYDGQRVLILDEYNSQIPLTRLNAILDRYPLELSARYSNHPAAFTEVWVISNLPPSAQYPDTLSAAERDPFIRRIGDPLDGIDALTDWLKDQRHAFALAERREGHDMERIKADWDTLHPYQTRGGILADHMALERWPTQKDLDRELEDRNNPPDVKDLVDEPLKDKETKA